MVNGIRLTLMIGPAVPIPVSKEILDALTSVEVTTTTDGPSVFQLSFTLSTRSPLHTLFLLSGGAGIPLVRVVIIITMGGAPAVLIDGVMTQHEISPGSDAGHAVLTAAGGSVTTLEGRPLLYGKANSGFINPNFVAWGRGPLSPVR